MGPRPSRRKHSDGDVGEKKAKSNFFSDTFSALNSDV